MPMQYSSSSAGKHTRVAADIDTVIVVNEFVMEHRLVDEQSNGNQSYER